MNGESNELQSNVKMPPHDLDAEEAVLGSLLIDPEAIFKIVTILRPEDFYREKNRWTYECCLALSERHEALNQITVANELSRQQKLEATGGAAYLSHLVYQVPTSVHAEYYANIVHRLAVMRRLISASNQIASIGYESPPDADDALDRAEAVLFRLRQGQTQRGFVHISEVLDRYFEESSLSPEHPGYLPHVPTGFNDLDKILGGLQRSDMIVMAGRPGMGKTSLALSIALQAARRHHKRIAIFSLEMSDEQLVQRLVSAETGIDSQRLRLATSKMTNGPRLFRLPTCFPIPRFTLTTPRPFLPWSCAPKLAGSTPSTVSIC
jgi:replicative DNA helicase